MKTFALIALAASTATTTPQPKLDQASRWLAVQIVSAATPDQLQLPVVENRLMLLFSVANSRLPDFVANTQRRSLQYETSRQRAYRIAKLLEKDLDNDGEVTKDELQTVFEPQSQLPLRAASGLAVNPTPEQSKQVLAQLIARESVADGNGDGAIDFEEMRAYAERPGEQSRRGAISEARLIDPVIVKAFDTSLDKTISADEFTAAIRATFALIDTDKDGFLSAEECRPFGRSTFRNNTF